MGASVWCWQRRRSSTRAPPPRRAVKTSLSQLRADADAVLENLDDGFLAFDATLRVKRSNAMAEAFIGRSRDGLQGATAAGLHAAAAGRGAA